MTCVLTAPPPGADQRPGVGGQFRQSLADGGYGGTQGGQRFQERTIPLTSGSRSIRFKASTSIAAMGATPRWRSHCGWVPRMKLAQSGLDGTLDLSASATGGRRGRESLACDSGLVIEGEVALDAKFVEGYLLRRGEDRHGSKESDAEIVAA